MEHIHQTSIDMNHIRSKEAAEAFLRDATKAGGRFDVFSSMLEADAAVREREMIYGMDILDAQELCCIFSGVYILAKLSDKKVFRELVPETEIATWIGHTEEILQQMINHPHWIRTGSLFDHDLLLFLSFCSLVEHPVAAAWTFRQETKILESIAKLVLSRKGDSNELPDEKFASCFHSLMHALYIASTEYFDNRWTSYKYFKKLESTGILEQFLRCATIREETVPAGDSKSKVLHELLCCPRIIKKKFKEGTPCGDTLKDILENPAPVCTKILPYLETLDKLSKLLQTKENEARSCAYCQKVGLDREFKLCAKCKRAFYCSRECQKPHWKEHKEFCIQQCREGRPERIPDSVIPLFLQRNYVNVMARLVEECDKAGGLRMEDMLLELDLRPDSDGRIPFLQDPPQLEFLPISRYLSRARERGFTENTIAGLLAVHARRSSDSGLLTFQLHPDTQIIQAYQTGNQENFFFTQEALDNFRIVMMNDDLF